MQIIDLVGDKGIEDIFQIQKSAQTMEGDILNLQIRGDRIFLLGKQAEIR